MLVEYVEKEMENAGWIGENSSDPMQQSVAKNILELIRVFVGQGHSGTSANYVLGHFNHLANHRPLGLITDEPDQWKKEMFGGTVKQHKRCPTVFKREDGTVFYTNARIFKKENGSLYTSFASRKDIKLPWRWTKPEIIDAKDEGKYLKGGE